ncbi:exodeoxyribonuclease VII large subunit [Roseovarius atlanticus]|uniref:exodeoxyribonuclease VII large subunit n=1 Tax=Roseovarius atlanticus TaxID=1641875 RepID=UPI001C9399BB|nr:exodeoxyribonuclease VII large subunit [Roseovarius atlanticus]MBY5988068.1 exodeoxyribonuclease VII large subunit [Roseovarius atlanticus]MBY6123459.1 exodeoxyribonuclease VII large subunit [Roseovarius atlanticus]MBY6147954.1 exodeoxyribonuclease VII large subunit [Roseovarius atlanticus]
MSDLIDDLDPGANAPEFSVSDLSGVIKRMIEGEFSHVRVKGEVGRVSRPRSGHVYMDLKDDRSVLAGVIWKGVASKLAVQPEEGMEVVATGRLTTFPGQSRYQIVIEDLKPAGMGALMAMLEARRKALAGEGLFAPERKKRLPYLPEVIGVVTSPSGAVIRDILHRLRDRFPRKVLIWPVAVQGEKCAPEVTRAIQGFNALTPGGALPRPDLLIVARGGGSIEDLWGFNEESVVRAAAASEIPLISAVGHETDTTLIDFASDKRAPTPTAAAELAVPVRLDLLAWLDGQEGRLLQALKGQVTARQQRLRDLSRALPRGEALLDGPRQRLDGMSDKLPGALRASIQVRQVKLSEKAGALRPGMLRERVRNRREGFASLAARVNTRALQRDINQKRTEFDRITKRLADVGARQITTWRDRLAAQDRLRETLGYKATLERGYAVVRGDGALVTTKDAAQAAGALEIEFADGRLAVGGGDAAASPSRAAEREPAAKPAPKAKKTPPEQGSLF